MAAKQAFLPPPLLQQVLLYVPWPETMCILCSYWDYSGSKCGNELLRWMLEAGTNTGPRYALLMLGLQRITSTDKYCQSR